ncbi:MAG: ABC transporter substrate-binding protein [Pseudomonadota bacterium]
MLPPTGIHPIWSAGNEYPAIALLASAGLTPSDVTMVPQEGLASTLLLENKADCVSTMSYNEARELSDAGLPAEDLIAYDAEAFGTVLLDDGLYIRGDALVDPAFAEKLDAFVAASMKGWTWAMANPEGAAGIVIDLAGLNQDTLEAQVRMMKGVSDLIGEEPVMDPTAFAKVADLLVDAGLIGMVPDYDAVVIDAP